MTLSLRYCISEAGLSSPKMVMDAFIGYLVSLVYQVVSSGIALCWSFFDTNVGA